MPCHVTFKSYPCLILYAPFKWTSTFELCRETSFRSIPCSTTTIAALTAAGTTVSIILLFGLQLFVSLPAISASILTSGGNDRGWVHRYYIKHPVPGTHTIHHHPPNMHCIRQSFVTIARAHVIHGYIALYVREMRLKWAVEQEQRYPINKRTRRSVEHILE